MAAQPSSAVRHSPEDEFYSQLTLGVIQFLENTSRIANVTLHKQQPTERTQIATWEQRHNVYMPDDMKRFYLSTEGFTLHWSYQYSRMYNCIIPSDALGNEVIRACRKKNFANVPRCGWMCRQRSSASERVQCAQFPLSHYPSPSANYFNGFNLILRSERCAARRIYPFSAFDANNAVKGLFGNNLINGINEIIAEEDEAREGCEHFW